MATEFILKDTNRRANWKFVLNEFQSAVIIVRAEWGGEEYPHNDFTMEQARIVWNERVADGCERIK